MFKKVVMGLLVALAVLLVVIAMQPNEFTLTRSQVVNAPAKTVFGHVNDFHKWTAWSPWAKRDPNMKTDYAGPDAGEGATYHWDGNQDVGEGRMTITKSAPHSLISVRLDFIAPMAATNMTEFTFVEQAGPVTLVTWTMTGHNNFAAKAFHLFMNIEKMVGPDFENGLAQLKAVAEAEAL